MLGALFAPSAYSVVGTAFVLAVLVGSVLLTRRHLALATYSLLTVCATLFFADWVSMPRHSWVAFPAIAQLVAAIDRCGPRWWMALLALFAAGQAVLVVASIKWSSFPP